MAKKDTRPCGRPYRALVGLSVKDQKTGQLRRLCEAGDVTSEIPACSVDWLLKAGKIEPVKEVADDE
jgi:hypothetical protein